MAKQIEIPKPTKVPDNWCWVAMGKLTSMKSGYPFDSHRFVAEPSSTTRPLIRIRDVVRGSTETFTDEECPDEYIITHGEILIGMDGDFNVAKWQSADALLNQRVCCIKSSCDLFLDDFLFYYLPDPLKKINDATPSVTVKHLSTKTLAVTPVPVPPLAEQRRIVDRIEYLFAKLDEAKEKAQSVLDSFETRKAAILHKAFTGELTAKWREEHGVVLGNWRQLTLSQCSSKIGDGLHGTPSFADDGEYYFVNGNNFAGQHIEIKPETKRVSVAEYEKHKIHLFKDVTVFVSINGTLGKTAFYNNEPVVLGKSACYVHVTDDLNKFFLRYYFETKEFIDYANTLATGSTIKNLGLKAMRNMPMSLPGVDEQIEIVSILDRLLVKEQQAKEAAEAVLEKIDLLKKSILARAFRGELGTNDAGEESALELLKKVL